MLCQPPSCSAAARCRASALATWTDDLDPGHGAPHSGHIFAASERAAALNRRAVQILLVPLAVHWTLNAESMKIRSAQREFPVMQRDPAGRWASQLMHASSLALAVRPL